MSTVSCPACARPNGAHRATCLYCGADMPAPSIAPVRKAKPAVAKKDLDRAFARAMARGDTRQLMALLEKRKETQEGEERSAPPAAPSGGEALLDEAPPERLVELAQKDGAASIPEPQEPVQPEPEPVVRPEDLHQDLVQAVERARCWEDDADGALEALREVGRLADELAERLQELEPPPPLVLPPFRLPWALFVAGTGEAALAPAIAGALELDRATALLLVRAAHPRVALRSRDRADLARRARRFREATGLPALVLDEARLRAQPRPQLALQLRPEGTWRLAQGERWLVEPDELENLPSQEVAVPEIALVVTGQVVLRRYRMIRGRRKDSERLTTHGERKISLLDLHHAEGIVRVVEGVTDLSEWPGLDRGSAPRAFRGLADWLEQHLPGIPHLARCTCQPLRQPERLERGQLEAAGWPSWEEHTRVCRCLYLGVSGTRD